MASKRKGGLGFEAARGIVMDSAVRTAAMDAVQPMAKLSFSLGKRRARRRTRKQLQQLEERISSVASLMAAYGPLIAEQLATIQRPRHEEKKKATVPALATGVVLGAGVMYLVEPGAGAGHRRQVQRLVTGLIS
jgi:hypothetical protein